MKINWHQVNELFYRDYDRDKLVSQARKDLRGIIEAEKKELLEVMPDGSDISDLEINFSTLSIDIENQDFAHPAIVIILEVTLENDEDFYGRFEYYLDTNLDFLDNTFSY